MRSGTIGRITAEIKTNWVTRPEVLLAQAGDRLVQRLLELQQDGDAAGEHQADHGLADHGVGADRVHQEHRRFGGEAGRVVRRRGG